MVSAGTEEVVKVTCKMNSKGHTVSGDAQDPVRVWDIYFTKDKEEIGRIAR